MAEIKTGVPYEATMTITPKRLGLNIFGEKVVFDETLKGWPVNWFGSWKEVETRDTKHRKAAAQMLMDFAADCSGWDVEASWGELFDDEPDEDDISAVMEIAADEMATNLCNAEGLNDDGDDE